MCGLVGYFGNFDPKLIELAVSAIDHRGPDDQGIYIDAKCGVGLGHRRLSILDLTEAGHQPMETDGGNICIVFNGEIYNYLELRTELEDKGVDFKSNSDTEVILELFKFEGIKMLDRLNGIFALAIFDKNKQEVWVARDRFGIKPLYYLSSKKGIVFASELKAILPYLKSEATNIDLETVERFLTFLWCPGYGTAFREIRKLGPGEALLIKDGKILERNTWHLLSQGRSKPSRMGADKAIASVQAALSKAVENQLVADVPVGAFLSGGLDSSAIVAFAAKHLPDIKCFTIDCGDSDSKFSDLKYAVSVAEHLGVELDVVPVNASCIASELESVIWHLDEPLADPAAVNVFRIASRARSVGVKVLLSGAGGDDLFSGYRRHLAMRYEWLWNWLPMSIRRGAAGWMRSFDKKSDFGRRLKRLALSVDCDGDIGLASYFVWQRREDLVCLFSPDIRDRLRRTEPLQPMLDYLKELSPNATRLDKMLSLEQRFFLADHNLIYTDKMSMAVGVEVRVPFLDNDVVSAATQIPDRLKQNGRVGKWVLKEAMRPYLPNNVINRPKAGFGVPLRNWILNDLADLIAVKLSEKKLRDRGIFDPQSVARLISENRSGTIDASYTIFSLLCIEIWCAKFIDDGNLKVNGVKGVL